MSNPKISVIVTAYNSEKTIKKCIKSLLNQTLKNIETIVVDDGSDDATANILKSFEGIKVITNDKNYGCGYSKNLALTMANGEYIGFVDSDDYVDKKYFEKLYKRANDFNADIAVGNILKHKSGFRIYDYHCLFENYGALKRDMMKLCTDRNGIFYQVGNKIFKTSMIKYFDIKFLENNLYENTMFVTKALDYANLTVSVKGANYHYVERKNSLLKTKSLRAKRMQDMSLAYGMMQDYCANSDICLPENLNYYTSYWYNAFVKTYVGNHYVKHLFLGFLPYKKEKVNFTFPVDLVYLWVDGSDEKWLEKKNYYQKLEKGELDIQAVNKGRYTDNDELRYSLRSVEKYAKWINKIYIVTDNQIPKWLDTSNEKVKVIFHKDFIPQDKLPLFNSEAIESYLPFIPGLSEHFLYACDDYYFGNYVTKAFFFTPDGKPIIRLQKQLKKINLNTSMYARSILINQNMIAEKFGKMYPYAPHHNIDAYRKTDFINCLEYFKEKYEINRNHKFRTEGDIQRVIIAYYTLATGNGKLKRISKISRFYSLIKRLRYKLKKKYQSDSTVITMKSKNPYEKFMIYKPSLFCTNDGEEITDLDRLRTRIFLEEVFPEKSSFELTQSDLAVKF